MKHFTLTMLSAALLSTSALAAPETRGAIVTGGVGVTGQDAIAQVQDNYNLKLVFTGDKGMYLSNVAVTVKDAKGNTVINNVTDGPMLLAELKPGRYSVEATAESFEQKRNINVGNKLNTYQVSFPIKDDIDVDNGVPVAASNYNSINSASGTASTEGTLGTYQPGYTGYAR